MPNSIKNSIWALVQKLFNDDELESRSLPDIYVDNLTAGQQVKIYDWLMSQCKIWGEPCLWDIELEKDILIRDYPHPAQAFIDGRVECFRHCLDELTINEVNMPMLSIFFADNEFIFDYEIGNEWNQDSVVALFEMFYQILLIAPNAQIYRTNEWDNSPSIEFSEAFNLYLQTKL